MPLWRGDFVSIKQLLEDFARYTYLPRLRDSGVLIDAIAEGLGLLTWDRESFAYADGWDEAGERYRALRCGQHVAVTEDSTGVLVKPEPARRQYDAERTPTPSSTPGGETPRGTTTPTSSGIIGANVKVTIEIDAFIPIGASEQIVRTVTENCRTLKFTSHGFEKE